MFLQNVSNHHAAWCSNPENHKSHLHHCEKLKCLIMVEGQ